MAVTRTPKVENPGDVEVATSTGQYLHFTVDAGGPIPIFTCANSIADIFNTDPANPQSEYEWDFLKDHPGDQPKEDELELRLKFLTNAKYTYTVELRDASGTVGTVLQIDYQGAPTDIEPESFAVERT